MSKRNKIVIETPESKALKCLRLRHQESLQDVADAMGVSKQHVHLMEAGRGTISTEYILNFLSKLHYGLADFELLVDKYSDNKVLSLRKQCHEKLDKIEDSKLEEIFDYLSEF